MRSSLRPSPGSLGRRCLAAVGMAVTLVAGSLAAPATATAAPAMSSPQQALDQFLTVTGEPGPHRVSGHYFTSPVPPKSQERIRPTALVGPSTPIAVGDSVCTVAVSGVDNQGNKIAITAGHCGKQGMKVRSLDAGEAGVIGTYVRSGYPDYGVIKLNPNVRLTNSYGRVTVNQLGGPVPGNFGQACKTGISTGTTCGPVLGVDGPFILAHICGSYGDSGGPLFVGNRLVGILNGGIGNLPSCTTPLQGPLHAPIAGAAWHVIQADLNAAGGAGAGLRLP